MPILFFVLVCILPGGLMFYLKPGMGGLIIFPFLLFAIYTYVFRVRTYGRAAVVSRWSFQGRIYLALSAVLSSIAGTFIGNEALYLVSGVLIFASIFLAVVTLREGPVYGWDDKG